MGSIYFETPCITASIFIIAETIVHDYTDASNKERV